MSLDLTKRRYSLLSKAKSIIKENLAVMFAFANINSSLALKLNGGKFHYFNSEDELNKIFKKCNFMFSNNQILPVWFVFSSCCNAAMIYLVFLQLYLLAIVCPCSKEIIICVDNIFKLFYDYWNLFYYFLFWSNHIYQMFFSLVISLIFTSFIRSLIYDGS